MKKLSIPNQTGEKWLAGFQRYIAADIFRECKTWEDLFTKVDEFDNSKNMAHLLFMEFKLINLMICIESGLCALSSYCFNNGLFKKPEAAKAMVIDRIKYSRNITDDEAEGLLKQEINDEDSRIWSPHALLFIADYSLGRFIDLLSGQTKEFPEKKNLLERLINLNQNRNLIIHNSTTSRVNINLKLNESLTEAEECLGILDNFVSAEAAR